MKGYHVNKKVAVLSQQCIITLFFEYFATLKQLQWGYEHQTSPLFEWCFLLESDYQTIQKPNHFGSDFKWSTKLKHFMYQTVITNFFVNLNNADQ